MVICSWLFQRRADEWKRPVYERNPAVLHTKKKEKNVIHCRTSNCQVSVLAAAFSIQWFNLIVSGLTPIFNTSYICQQNSWHQLFTLQSISIWHLLEGSSVVVFSRRLTELRLCSYRGKLMRKSERWATEKPKEWFKCLQNITSRGKENNLFALTFYAAFFSLTAVFFLFICHPNYNTLPRYLFPKKKHKHIKYTK